MTALIFRRFLITSQLALSLLTYFIDASAQSLQITPLPDPSPMRWLSSRVSGAGQNGFKDGPFWQALFNHPEGLVVDSSGSVLYVADSGNARIRRVLLRQGHATETLAGTGERGGRDGSFQTAQFENPTRLALLDDNTLLVAERIESQERRFRFRRVDLVNHEVSTVPLHPASCPAGISGISDLAAGLEPDVVVFITSEGQGPFAINLLTGEIKRISLRASPDLKRLWSVSVQDRRLLATDTGSEQLVSFDMSGWSFNANPAVDARVEVAVPKVSLVRSLKNVVYVTQVGVNCISRFIRGDDGGVAGLQPVGMLTAGGVPFSCLPGEPLDEAKRPALYFANFHQPDMIALNPADPNQIFISNWPWGNIESVRDYDQLNLLGNISSARPWMPDFRYPEKKAFGVFRILMVGDSRTYQFGEDPDPTAKLTKVDTLAKQLELQLNLSSAMRGSSQQYEVLNLSEVSWFPIWSWGQYRIPHIVREYDIDLVLLSFLGAPRTELLLQFPLPDTDSEPVEEPKQDSEWAFLPDIEKASQGPITKLIQALREERPNSFRDDGKILVPQFREFCSSSRLRSVVFDTYGILLSHLQHAVQHASRKSMQGVPLVMAYLPEDYEGVTECGTAMMQQICKESGVPLVNLAPLVTATSSSFYMSHGIGGGHPTRIGFHVYGDILADALLQSGVVK